MAGLIFRRLAQVLRDEAEDTEDDGTLCQPRELAALALSDLRSGPGTDSTGALHFELIRHLRWISSAAAAASPAPPDGARGPRIARGHRSALASFGS
jgi:hypothetical protein